jgi:hypothetical protein
MTPIAAVFAAIENFNKLAPAAIQLVAAIRNADGSLTALDTLDQADALLARNEDEITRWLADNKK